MIKRRNKRKANREERELIAVKTPIDSPGPLNPRKVKFNDVEYYVVMYGDHGRDCEFQGGIYFTENEATKKAKEYLEKNYGRFSHRRAEILRVVAKEYLKEFILEIKEPRNLDY